MDIMNKTIDSSIVKAMDNQNNMTNWMDGAKLNNALPDGKGIVGAIHPPVNKDTRFGVKQVCQIVINGSDGNTINVQMFLPSQFPLLHPKSNLAKILQCYGCNELKELIGKEVQVEEVGDMLWKIKGGD